MQERLSTTSLHFRNAGRLAATNKADEVRYFAAAFTLAIATAIVCPGVLLLFDSTPKICALGLGVACYFACLAISTPRFIPRLNGVWFSLCALMFWQILITIVSYLHSPDRSAATLGTPYGLGAFPEIAVLTWSLTLGYSLLCVPRGSVWLIRQISLFAAIISGYSISQFLGFDPVFPQSLYIISGVVRPPGTLGQSGILAAVLSSSTFICFVLVEEEKSNVWRAIGVLGAFLSILGTIMSGTRSGLLGLLGGLIVLAAFRARRSLHHIKLFLAAVITAVILICVVPQSGVRTRIDHIMADPSGGGRAQTWIDTLRMVSLRPVIGYGPDVFARHFPKFISLMLARSYPDVYRESAHNLVLDRIASTGVIGLLAMAAPFALVIIQLWKTRHVDAIRSSLLCGGLSSALIIHQFWSLTVCAAMHLYALLALAAVVVSNDRRAIVWKPVKIRTVVRVSSICLCTMSTVLACNLWNGDRDNMRTAKALSEHRIKEALDVALAASWNRAGKQDLWLSITFLQAAEAATDSAEQQLALEGALELGNLAIGSAMDRHNAYLNLATVYVAMSRFVEAERALRQAAEWAPKWYKPHWILAELLNAEERMAEATNQASIAVSLAGNTHPEVKQTFERLSGKR